MMTPLPWFRIRTERPIRLFCFPYAGAGGSVFHGWPRIAPPDVEIVPVTPPGRLHRIRELPILDFDRYIESLGQAIMEVIDKPFACFGHSLGGLVAFELSRWLRARAVASPIQLTLSACGAPDLPPLSSLWGDAASSDEALLALLSSHFGPLPPALRASQELRELALTAFRDDIALAGSYRYQEKSPLACPILALVGREDVAVGMAEARGWQRHTTCAFTLCCIPGPHLFIDSLPAPLLAHICAIAAGREPSSAGSDIHYVDAFTK